MVCSFSRFRQSTHWFVKHISGALPWYTTVGNFNPNFEMTSVIKLFTLSSHLMTPADIQNRRRGHSPTNFLIFRFSLCWLRLGINRLLCWLNPKERLDSLQSGRYMSIARACKAQPQGRRVGWRMKMLKCSQDTQKQWIAIWSMCQQGLDTYNSERDRN